MSRKWIDKVLDRPKLIVFLTLLAVAAAMFQFPKIKVDTDPENMLSANAPVRKFHHAVREEFALYDFIVLGIENTTNPDGVFNVDTLGKVHEITKAIQRIEGVISRDVISPSTKENIIQEGVGTISFDWFMPQAPKTREAALAIREAGRNHPMFDGSIVSEDGKALIIFVPIERKDMSYVISQEILAIAAKYPGIEEYFITGLPVAEDQFGVEMFRQMAFSAPLAGLIIFLLMWFFFRSVLLCIAPMLVAIATVIITMGLLIGLGFPVHIMSSMIPIFLMPISVLDCVHILSEFFDRYRKFNDRRKAIGFVMSELFTPMLFTSLTSIAGFFSLSFAPIPPVQVFGILVAFGVFVAWLLTMLFIPAYIMLLSEKSLRDFGASVKDEAEHAAHHGPLDKLLYFMQRASVSGWRGVLIVTMILVGASVYGISRINVNDNPVRWFTENHSIRVADKVLNSHFAGTYTAYLVLEDEGGKDQLFIQPDMLRWMEKFQAALVGTGYVGKVTSVTDVVKKIYYELLGGDKVNNVVPDSPEAVAQCLIQFENSRNPDDLWKMTVPDYSKAVLWLQLRSGDNRDMERVLRFVDKYMKDNPAPFKLKSGWAGKTYINVVWQNSMVVGMLRNFMGSFIIVLFMMLFLFRSPVKALISMVPLTVTILFIYGLLGFIGKDYDMPVAVLSALTLGLSVDFAIHFIQRAMELYAENHSWPETAAHMFQGPGRAIFRNAVVVAVGFAPLLAAPLVPYRTVGFFMLAIMMVSGFGTLLILPALVSWLPGSIFDAADRPRAFGCRCSHCLLTAFFVSLAVAYVLNELSFGTFGAITVISIFTMVALAAACHFASRRNLCKNINSREQ